MTGASADRRAAERPKNAVTIEDVAYILYPLVPFRVLCAAARLQGRLHHLVRRRERAIVRQNLGVAFGHERDGRELDHLARVAFEYRQLRGLLLTLSPKLPARLDARLFPMEGLEHLEGARTGECGPILVTSHLNSICTFIALERLRGRGYDLRLTLPSKTEPYPLSRFRRALYRFTGGRTFVERTGAFYAQFNIRPIVRCLTGGTGVIVVGDGWHSASFVKTEFLGHPVHFTTGAMSIGRLTGAPVVPMFTLGSPPDGLRFVFEEPILADPAVETQADIQRMVTEYARRLEEHVRANIPCWQHWFEEEALDTMEHWPEQSLDERYRVG